jgi:short-subunit dehydrogenase
MVRSIGKGKLAIVTGASRGIGLSISKKLILLGYNVFGCCRDPEKCTFTDPSFNLSKVNLMKTSEMERWIQEIKKKGQVDLLIHNAGKGYFAPFEELNWIQIEEMITLHITAPMLLTNSLLRSLKESAGRIIFIGSIAGTQISPWGSAYGATKAGLHHFGRELFQELRKSGVKVTNLIPDIVDTDFYQGLPFGPDIDSKSHLLADCLSSAVENILTQRDGTVISELRIQPEKFKIKKNSRI